MPFDTAPSKNSPVAAPKSLDVISETATLLSIVEVGLGSAVHGFKIPLGGHLLSINQGVFLTRAVRQLRGQEGVYRSPLYISNISALLKSLSPAGNKLGPMVSISMQGFLYSLPVMIFGANIVGVLLGMILMSVWAFAQPFVTLYLFFGQDLFRAASFYLEKMQQSMPWAPASIGVALAIAIGVKAVLAAVAGVVALRAPESAFEKFIARYTTRVPTLQKDAGIEPTLSRRLKMVVKDLTRPFFLFSIAMMAVFFYFLEDSWSRTIWLMMRPLAIAFIFFYISRSPMAGRLADRLRASPRFAGFMQAFDLTLVKLKRRQSTEGSTR